MDTRWYLHSINDNTHTNEFLAQVIGEQHPDAECRDMLCSDGVRRNLYRCPSGYQEVRRAIANIARLNLNLEVFQETSGGLIVQYDLWKQEVRKKARRTRTMRDIRRAS
jgi:hypothetical protein